MYHVLSRNFRNNIIEFHLISSMTCRNIIISNSKKTVPSQPRYVFISLIVCKSLGMEISGNHGSLTNLNLN